MSVLIDDEPPKRKKKGKTEVKVDMLRPLRYLGAMHDHLSHRKRSLQAKTRACKIC